MCATMNKPCRLRTVDSRDTEQEWADRHIGYYVWMPTSIRHEISEILGHPVYCAGREKNGDAHGSRIFLQTGQRDGNYLLTFEVVSKARCKKVIKVVERPVTQAQRDEMDREWEKARERL